jgi:predicted membrane protein
MSEEPENRFWCSRSPFSRLFFAGFLIVAGTLLFLGNLGVLPSFNIWSFWPMLIVAVGISKIVNARDSGNRVLGFLLSFFGVFFLLISLGVVQIRARDHSWPISMLLIAFGLTMLIKVLEERDPAKPKWTGFRPFGMNTPNGLSDFTVMGTVKRRVDTTDFRGGRALSILGTIELDLHHARITEPSQTIQLEVSAILGSAKIRVPENWRVQIHGASILGTYEDKTIPPQAGVDAPTLLITGYAFMSSIEIED